MNETDIYTVLVKTSSEIKPTKISPTQAKGHGYICDIYMENLYGRSNALLTKQCPISFCEQFLDNIFGIPIQQRTMSNTNSDKQSNIRVKDRL